MKKSTLIATLLSTMIFTTGIAQAESMTWTILPCGKQFMYKGKTYECGDGCIQIPTSLYQKIADQCRAYTYRSGQQCFELTSDIPPTNTC